jgi:uncharacterized protein (DUF58 family)
VLTAGIALIVFGWAAGVRDVVRVGGVLLLLPLVASLVVHRVRPSMSCDRTLTPRRVAAGSQARVELHVANTGRSATPALLAEDELPPTLGRGPRFTFSRVEAGGERGAAYTVPPAPRGRYEVGPLRVRIRDAFGLVERSQQVGQTTTLIVTPQIIQLTPVSMGGAFTAGSHSGRRSLAAHGEDDIGTRPWRDGDDLRRVHWRTTARTGELAVRREEQPWSASATVLLDTRIHAHTGQGRTSSFEWAVSAAASVAVHLGQRGLPCRLLTSTGRVLDPGFSGAAGAAAIVDELALITPDRAPGLPAHRSSSSGGVLVAVVGALRAEDVSVLLANRGSGQGIAILLDVAAWPSTGSRGPVSGSSLEQTGLLLRTSGWDVMLARPDSRLDDLWLTLGAPLRGTA